MTREFILNTLLPYKEDPSTCGFNPKTQGCFYKTEDGKKCAVGKHMLEGEWQKCADGAETLFNDYDKNQFLTKEALEQDLTVEQWDSIQQYHDAVAQKDSKESINRRVSWLQKETGFEFPELLFD